MDAGGAFLHHVPWDTVGATGTVILTVMLVLTGKLIPVSSHMRAVEALTRENASLRKETEEWQKAYRTVSEAHRISSEQVTEILEYARTADAVLRSLQTIRSDAP